MALNIPFRNAYYRFASSYSFLFFISWSLWWSLYAIWLKGHLGLTGTELGTLYSCNQVNHLIPTRVLVKGGEITCKILK